MLEKSKIKSLIIKYRVTVIAVLVFVVALALIVSFAGNREEDIVFDDGVAESAEILQPMPKESGYGLYIDGRFVAAFDDESTLGVALDDYVASSRINRTVVDENIGYAEEVYTGSRITNEISITAGEYPADSFISVGELASHLSSGVTDYNGNLLGVSLELEYQNTVTTETTHEFETRNIYTDALIDGKTNLVTEGVDGVTRDTYVIICSADGSEVSRHLLASETLQEEVDEVIEIGTYVTSKSITTASIGVFAKPYDGYISSGFGTRWGKLHRGLDICAKGRSCAGDPGLAAADGVVIKAESHPSYGNYVVIDHGDGIETLYAHFQKLSVTVGQVVHTGDEVGKIGMTGHATGYHLHFEVHINGEPVNPLLFVDYSR